MATSRLGLILMMAVACLGAGCKAAGLAIEVAAVVAVGAAKAAAEEPVHGDEERLVRVPVEAPPPPPVVVVVQPRCLELGATPELPGDTVAVRTVACGGRVMVQDAQTGLWREHR